MNIRKTFIYALLIIAVVAGGYFIFFFDENEKNNNQPEEVSQGDLVAQELADKYQAISGWEEEDLSYTLDFQERLVTGKPVLFRGYVEDIAMRSGKYFVRFSSSLFSYGDYVLELECSRKFVDEILAQRSSVEDYLSSFAEYAVVAEVEDVVKPTVALRGYSTDEYEAELDFESSELFIIMGTCVDAAYIGFD